MTATAVTRARALGHLALHYRPGDEQAARRLLEHLGCTLVDNGPKPGEDGFCTVLVDVATANHADNIMFLSRMNPAQLALEDAICDALRTGTDDEHEAVRAFRDFRRDKPESVSHIGLRYKSFADLEAALLAIERDAAPGGALAGRVEVKKYRARPGINAEADATIGASPAFTGSEPPAFANHWVQCFVRTDLFGYGILAFGQTIELDYVFEPFFAEPPRFGS
ncbi:MAG TPA: hypothetical protein VF183_00225 [Acidimicrobiales bacterium]